MKGGKSFDKNVNVMITQDVYTRVAEIAKDQGLRRQEYIRTLLGWAVTNNIRLVPNKWPHEEMRNVSK